MLYQEGTDLKEGIESFKAWMAPSPDAIRGRMSYTQGSDFSTFSGVSYQYSPYLLEGLLHILNFHCVMRDGSEARSHDPLWAIGRNDLL